MTIKIMLQWMVMLVVLTTQVQASQTDCPESCMCLGEFVQCQNLSDHATFPSGTETILIERANIKELHVSHFAGLESLKVIEFRENSKISIINSNVFSNLKHLDGIFISDTNIGTIKENAFYNLSHLRTLDIHHSNISNIETKAFNKLSQISRIELASNNITSISSSAFHDITEIKSFVLYLNEMKEFQTDTFQNIQCKRVEFYLNTIRNIPCNSIESLFTFSNDTKFYSNNFKCDCGINWMAGVPELQSHLSNNVCLNGTSLDEFYTSEAVAACGPSIGCGQSSAASTGVPHSSTKKITPKYTTKMSTFSSVTTSVDDTRKTQETAKSSGRSSSTASLTNDKGTSKATDSYLHVTIPTQQILQKTAKKSTRMPKVSRKFLPKVQADGSSNSSQSLEIVCVYLLLLTFGIL
ncbi:hypothetical protein LOTGIDRAFT_171705 [Lottia gigantea]|uniref:LRRNT domain-containing protein n=1 Tax=Lottia gigantea TaxID=225164 RepID=V4AGP8_LOTGI|nr:hypothetical protein LOTGIDRAFT_171705 [Lottia gigantea]ESP03219.1 hypothetical protein LOTGIDRAFT_171705 [Lottia gigantea]